MDIVYWGNFILIPISILEFILAIYIFSRKPRSSISISFGIFTFAVALWVFSNGFGYVNENVSIKWIWWNSTYIFASMIAASFLFFSWVFPYKSKEVKTKEYLLVVIPTIIFTIFIIFSDLFVKGWKIEETLHSFVFGFVYHIFAIYFIFFWIWGFIILFLKYRKSDGIHRWQLRYLLVGVALSSIFGMTTNLIIPWLGYSVKSFDFIGPGSSIIWLGLVSYIIWKK